MGDSRLSRNESVQSTADRTDDADGQLSGRVSIRVIRVIRGGHAAWSLQSGLPH